jgi:uncharacterized protein YggE
MSKISKKLGKSLGYGLICLSLMGIMGCNEAIAQERLLRTLTVTGQGVENIPTTLTEVRLGVEIQGKTATEVQQQVAQKTSSVVEFLKSRQVEKLQTTGINLQPQYDYSSNQRRFIGYNGSNMVSFRIQTDKITDILDKAVESGATRIDGISFTAADEAISAAQKVALQEATQDAQQQANAVLSSLGFTNQEIVSIQVNHASPPQPLMRAEMMAVSADSRATTPVIGGEQNVSASVTLQIRY